MMIMAGVAAAPVRRFRRHHKASLAGACYDSIVVVVH